MPMPDNCSLWINVPKMHISNDPPSNCITAVRSPHWTNVPILPKYDAWADTDNVLPPTCWCRDLLQSATHRCPLNDLQCSHRTPPDRLPCWPFARLLPQYNIPDQQHHVTFCMAWSAYHPFLPVDLHKVEIDFLFLWHFFYPFHRFDLMCLPLHRSALQIALPSWVFLEYDLNAHVSQKCRLTAPVRRQYCVVPPQFFSG